jgi:sulfur-carrier protein
MITVRVELPVHLRTLAGIDGEVALPVDGAPTIRGVLDLLEDRYPMLRGTIRDHGTGRRRAYIRYFADGEDLSFEPPDAPLPDAVRSGADAFRVLGAIAGG